MNTPNALELRLHVDLGYGFASIEVLVDEQPLDIGAGWDVLALVASATAEGGYYLGNCGCGVPDCARIHQPVAVRHKGDRVTWQIPLPYALTPENEHESGELAFDFDATQYKAQAAGLLDALRAAADQRPTLTLDCYPADRAASVIRWAEEGGAGWGGCEALPD